MNKRNSGDLSQGNMIVPSRHPLPGVDDAPIDAGLDDEQVGGKNAVQPEAMARKQKDKDEQSRGFDPDVLSN